LIVFIQSLVYILADGWLVFQVTGEIKSPPQTFARNERAFDKSTDALPRAGFVC
jgi:hypothetical protein